ncbi:hypothetical protein F5X96DRAFT_392359 [Biscogniauxia mediterranea]|nr:hypothetical protein F5X96DRAFT_392359 [Biscogniauxia mediterranea]
MTCCLLSSVRSIVPRAAHHRSSPHRSSRRSLTLTLTHSHLHSHLHLTLTPHTDTLSSCLYLLSDIISLAWSAWCGSGRNAPRCAALMICHCASFLGCLGCLATRQMSCSRSHLLSCHHHPFHPFPSLPPPPSPPPLLHTLRTDERTNDSRSAILSKLLQLQARFDKWATQQLPCPHTRNFYFFMLLLFRCLSTLPRRDSRPRPQR